MKINFIVSPKSGISWHRLLLPMEFMQWDEGDSCEMLWINEDEHLIDCDILYYNKFISMTPDRIQLLKNKGTKIVVDIDDSWDLPVNHPFYSQWTKSGNAKRVEENIKIADLVTCTTLRLQEKIRTLNKNTVVIPNAFPFGEGIYKPDPKEHDKTTFIYVAGSTHLGDVNLLKGKFERIGTHDYIRNNSKFILAGYEPTPKITYNTKEDMEAQNNNYTISKGNGIWDKMSTIFSKTKSFEIFGSTDLENYINYYDFADVAIVPLVENEWNGFKSVLKIIESAVKGIPVICSKVAPYSDLIPCEGIMWVQKSDDWIKWFKYCIDNPNFVKDMGRKLQSWVSEEYNLINWNNTRKEVFKSLLNK